jgi:excisionase family DNA binding protein
MATIKTSLGEVHPMGPLLNSQQVGERLGKHEKSVRIMALRGEIQAIRLGGRTVRFTEAAVAEYIARARPADS